MAKKFDQSNMRQVILDFPKQFKVGVEAAKNIKTSANRSLFSNIIICGMGGSALPGDVFVMINNHLLLTKLPVFIHQNYGLHPMTNKNSFVVCISYSGNTEETISAFKEARKKKLSIAAIASGGKLIELAKKNNVPFAQIAAGNQPRCALGYQFSALIKILSNFKLIKNLDKELFALEKNLAPHKLEKTGLSLAKKLKGKIPLVYSSEDNKCLARIWKIKFNENSKIPSFYNSLPELNHNEMTGMGDCEIKEWRELFQVIFLSDKTDHPRIIKRMNILSEIFQKRNIKTNFVQIEGKNILDKIFNNNLIADWTSYYLAVSRNIDPTPVKLVEEFKKKMADE